MDFLEPDVTKPLQPVILADKIDLTAPSLAEIFNAQPVDLFRKTRLKSLERLVQRLLSTKKEALYSVRTLRELYKSWCHCHCKNESLSYRTARCDNERSKCRCNNLKKRRGVGR